MEEVAVMTETVEASGASIEGAGAGGVDLAVVGALLAAIDAAREARDCGVETLPDALKRKERVARVAELQRPLEEATAGLAQYLRGFGFGELAPVHVVQDGEVFLGRLGGHGVNIDAPPPGRVENGRMLFLVKPGLAGWPGYAGLRVPSGDYLVDLEQLRAGHRAGASGPACEVVVTKGAGIEESVIVPGDVPAQLRVVSREDGWHYGVYAILPEGSIDDEVEDGADLALPTREAALDAARERLVRWLSDQKEHGAKRHRREAEELQVSLLGMTFEAAAAPAPVALSELVPRLIPLSRLVEAPNNPRGELVEVGIEEMAASMREAGFRPWLPIVARELEDGTGMIAAGHRRSRSARRAGLVEVPCVLKRMTDAEFLDILNFDNGGREDVHPLYEAAGWRDWMHATGKGVLDIAARIGKSKEYVYMRLKFDQLIPEAKQAFLEKKFSPEHAIQMARRPESVQRASLKYLEPNQYNGRIASSREFADWLAGDQTSDLAEAVFDRADVALLAGVGACGSCPKLQGNDPGFVLPAATEEDEPEDLARRPQDCCLDPRCFRQKTDNHFVRIKRALEAESGEAVLQVCTSYGKTKKGVLAQGQYEVVQSGGQLAVVVDGYSGVGETIRVKVKPEASKPKQETREQAAARKQTEEEAEKDRKAKAQRELQVRTAIVDAVVKAAGGSVSRGDLQGLLVAILSERGQSAGDWLCGRHDIKNAGWQWGQRLANVLPKMKDSEIAALAIELSVAHELSDYAMQRPATDLYALARRHKVDAEKIRKALEPAEKTSKKPRAKKAGAKKKASPKKLSAATRTRIAAAQRRRWAAAAGGKK